jgi:hypothetical protein
MKQKISKLFLTALKKKRKPSEEGIIKRVAVKIFEIDAGHRSNIRHLTRLPFSFERCVHPRGYHSSLRYLRKYCITKTLFK